MPVAFTPATPAQPSCLKPPPFQHRSCLVSLLQPSASHLLIFFTLHVSSSLTVTLHANCFNSLLINNRPSFLCPHSNHSDQLPAHCCLASCTLQRRPASLSRYSSFLPSTPLSSTPRQQLVTAALSAQPQFLLQPTSASAIVGFSLQHSVTAASRCSRLPQLTLCVFISALGNPLLTLGSCMHARYMHLTFNCMHSRLSVHDQPLHL